MNDFTRLHPRILNVGVPRILATLILGTVVQPALATFHFMQIEQVAAGIYGDPEAQYIQLRMRSNGQEHVQRAKLVAWDAAGQNPVVLIEFDHPVTGAQAGDHVLAVTQRLMDCSGGTLQPDFILTRPIPAAYLEAGSLTFESRDEDFVAWRLSWGGAQYTGSNAGALTNNNLGDFGPPVPGSLLTDLRAWQFQGKAEDTGHSNATDYILTAEPAALINNAGQEWTPSVGNCASQEPDGGDINTLDTHEPLDGEDEPDGLPDQPALPRNPCAPGVASLGLLSLAMLCWLQRRSNDSRPRRTDLP